MVKWVHYIQKNCNVEHSWRVFNVNYHNLWYIFSKLDILDNFTEIKNNCVVNNSKYFYLGNCLRSALFNNISISEKIYNYYKYFDIFFCCKERNITQYDDIYAYDHFNKNNFVKLLLGPYSGLEPTKVSLSGIYKNCYSLLENKNYGYVPNTKKNIEEIFGFITKLPTNDAIFDNWEKYLVNKGIKIIKNSNLTNINIINNKIQSININNYTIYGDEFIFGCSLRDINKVIKNINIPNSLKQQLNLLEQGNLQLYFTFNIYFKQKLEIKCDTFTLLEEPWSPIIQRKIHWGKIIDKCKSNKDNVTIPIREVWNVGLLDYFKGTNNKILSECNLEEAVNEGIQQIKHNEYIQNIFYLNNTTFDECYIDFECFETFKNVNNKLIDTNPKYSVNVGTIKNTPSTQPKDLPENMYLSGYYVDNEYGGATMESSCITGLNAAEMIIKKYKLKYTDILPFKHNNHILLSYFNFLYPFQLFDTLLFYLHIPPITKFVNTFYLLIFLVIIFLILIAYCMSLLIKFIYNKKYYKLLKLTCGYLTKSKNVSNPI